MVEFQQICTGNFSHCYDIFVKKSTFTEIRPNNIYIIIIVFILIHKAKYHILQVNKEYYNYAHIFINI